MAGRRGRGVGRPRAVAAGVLERALWVVGIVAGFAALTAFMTPAGAAHDRRGQPQYGDPLFSTRPRVGRPPAAADPSISPTPTSSIQNGGRWRSPDRCWCPRSLAAPLIWAGVPIVVYNVMLLSGYALSGAGMFLLVRSLTGSWCRARLRVRLRLPPVPRHALRASRTADRPVDALCLWALHRTVTQGRMRDGLLTGLFLALQCLSS
jgi:hypothetical protein